MALDNGDQRFSLRKVEEKVHLWSMKRWAQASRSDRRAHRVKERTSDHASWVDLGTWNMATGRRQISSTEGKGGEDWTGAVASETVPEFRGSSSESCGKDRPCGDEDKGIFAEPSKVWQEYLLLLLLLLLLYK